MNKHLKVAAVAAVCLIGMMFPARADTSIQPLPISDPTGMAVPDINAAPQDRGRGDYDSYFYFHKNGVTYQRAFADLDQCRMFAESAQIVAMPPFFVPLGGALAKEQRNYEASALAQYGLVGVVIVGVIVANVEDDNRRAITRRCMMYKGYARYGTSSKIWDEINRGNDAEKIARQAVIASGPQPTSGAITP